MPKTKNKLPQDGDAVRFRIAGDKHLHSGTYTTMNGFEICNSFMCYTMEDVDYWSHDKLEDINTNYQPQFAHVIGVPPRETK